MTEKQTELHRIVLRLAESGELATLTKLMLDIESTIEKYKRLEEAAMCLKDTYWGQHEDMGLYCFQSDPSQLFSILKELEQE